MRPSVLDEVMSSEARRGIESALSVRPRTLGELASATGISVQGVIRHLKRLEEAGLVEERRLSTRTLKARTVYVAKSHLVGDYSTADLTIVKATERRPPVRSRERNPDLEKTAAEVLVLRQRVREQARRLGRTIDELVDQRVALEGGLDGLSLSPVERLILEVILTEETIEDGMRVLSKFYGIGDRRSIEGVLAKARRNVRE